MFGFDTGIVRFTVLAAALVCLGAGRPARIEPSAAQPAPPKGRCPLKDGIMTSVKGVSSYIGASSTGVITGKDSLVLAPKTGWVMEFYPEGFGFDHTITIRVDTTMYVYNNVDVFVVKEHQKVLAGQVIGYARKKTITFYATNLYQKKYLHPDEFLDCVCEMTKPAPEAPDPTRY
ncbi:MAG: peptidoglycan DD-metalloendopeptidase family protein [Bacteroidetes bacterium]|nr:peptidoglycan DD-metalloendopeptidase family protein [Bacteroidota bacterium]